mgnify:CR=1 FL=1
MIEPLSPRITKSTAVAAVKARFNNTAELLLRYELAKSQANLWDGERDGIREAVKTIPDGQYDKVILSTTETAEVLYPNASGKFQLESCLQTTVPITKQDGQVVVFQIDGSGQPEVFLDAILHELQKGKDVALEFLKQRFVGAGDILENSDLYEKKGSSKAKITILP